MSRHRDKMSRIEVGAWLRKHKPLRPLILGGAEVGTAVKMNQALLRKWLHDRKIPTPVRQHIYIFYRYRQHRGWAN